MLVVATKMLGCAIAPPNLLMLDFAPVDVGLRYRSTQPTRCYKKMAKVLVEETGFLGQILVYSNYLIYEVQLFLPTRPPFLGAIY
ncbi:MAG: hypothetical protein SXA11_16945 [Cyanobacteriota bacterium]|nr:hypothetical protein [Cyanobacteriota bacterium]